MRSELLEFFNRNYDAFDLRFWSCLVLYCTKEQNNLKNTKNMNYSEKKVCYFHGKVTLNQGTLRALCFWRKCALKRTLQKVRKWSNFTHFNHLARKWLFKARKNWNTMAISDRPNLLKLFKKPDAFARRVLNQPKT